MDIRDLCIQICGLRSDAVKQRRDKNYMSPFRKEPIEREIDRVCMRAVFCQEENLLYQFSIEAGTMANSIVSFSTASHPSDNVFSSLLNFSSLHAPRKPNNHFLTPKQLNNPQKRGYNRIVSKQLLSEKRQYKEVYGQYTACIQTIKLPVIKI